MRRSHILVFVLILMLSAQSVLAHGHGRRYHRDPGCRVPNEIWNYRRQPVWNYPPPSACSVPFSISESARLQNQIILLGNDLLDLQNRDPVLCQRINSAWLEYQLALDDPSAGQELLSRLRADYDRACSDLATSRTRQNRIQSRIYALEAGPSCR